MSLKSLTSGIYILHMLIISVYNEFCKITLLCLVNNYLIHSIGTVLVDGHRVTQPDISATNGVVHKLNYVLIPASLSTQIKNL